MRSVLLEFAHFSSPHNGLAVHSIIKNCLSKWVIDKKLCSITSDSGSEMCRSIQSIEQSLEQPNMHV